MRDEEHQQNGVDLGAGKIEIESPGEQFGLFSTATLDPEPIPLDVKIGLIGDPLLYYLLCAYDPEFPQLFKVTADFADEMVRDERNQALYVKLIAGLVQKNKLHPFDRSAIARVIEQSARMAGDARKLSTNIQNLADLLREANYWANKQGIAIVSAADVQQPELSIEALVHDVIFTQGGRTFFVIENERWIGMITLHNIRSLPKNVWPVTTVRQAMTPVAQLHCLTPANDLVEALDTMVAEDVNQMPVVEEGRLVGLVARDDLLRAFRVRAELGV